MTTHDTPAIEKGATFIARNIEGNLLQAEALEDITTEMMTLAIDIAKRGAWMVGANYAIVLAAQGKVTLTPISRTETRFREERTEQFDATALPEVLELIIASTRHFLPSAAQVAA